MKQKSRVVHRITLFIMTGIVVFLVGISCAGSNMEPKEPEYYPPLPMPTYTITPTTPAEPAGDINLPNGDIDRPNICNRKWYC